MQELGFNNKFNKYDNYNSDEIDEKAEAVEMLSCLVEETGAGFVDYIGPTQKILLGVITYHLSDQVRIAAACGLPALVNSAKLAGKS